MQMKLTSLKVLNLNQMIIAFTVYALALALSFALFSLEFCLNKVMKLIKRLK